MIAGYVANAEQWAEIAHDVTPIHNTIMKVRGMEITLDGSTLHGYVFVGALTKKTTEFLRPMLLVFDECGTMLDFDERTIIQTFKDIPQSAFNQYEPEKPEMELITTCYDQIAPFMAAEYLEHSNPAIGQNEKRVKNWIDNQRGQYKAGSDEMRHNIAELTIQKNASKHFQEKIVIQKKIDRLEKELIRRDERFHISMLDIERQAEQDCEAFNAQYAIDPLVLVNLVVKF
jgi:hypothetical protein